MEVKITTILTVRGMLTSKKKIQWGAGQEINRGVKNKNRGGGNAPMPPAGDAPACIISSHQKKY